MSVPQYLVVHHSVSSREDTTIAMIRQWHLDRGWDDVGYHLVIEGDGALRQGRAVGTVGAHCKGVNQLSIGVCVVGNNLDEEQCWSKPQWRQLWKVVDAVQLLWPQLEIKGHRDFAPTECPGLEISNHYFAQEE